MSGSGRGIAIAVIATTLLWLAAAVGAAFLLVGSRAPAPDPVVLGGPPVFPPQLEPPDPGPVPDAPTPPVALPAVPPVPLASAELSRVRVDPTKGHLDELLRAEIQASEASGRRVVAYFSAAWCQPCRAVDRTLGASDVNARLGQLQLVEVDVDAFSAVELHRAGMLVLDQDIEAIPLFCVLRSREPPVCIDGGAWGDDTDSNIRSVLVPFLASPPSGVAPHEPDRITPI